MQNVVLWCLIVCESLEYEGTRQVAYSHGRASGRSFTNQSDLQKTFLVGVGHGVGLGVGL